MSVMLDGFSCFCMKDDLQVFMESEETCCDAVEDMNGGRIGCNQIVHGPVIKLHRSSICSEYQRLCTEHLRRLHSHHMCPYCGLFCTQGPFMICQFKHLFHQACLGRTVKSNQLKCLHCTTSSIKLCVVSSSVNSTQIFSLDHQIEYTNQHSMQSDIPDLSAAIEALIMAGNTEIRQDGYTEEDAIKAVCDGDLGAIAMMITSGFDFCINLKNFEGGTCLHGAVMHGMPALVKLLLCSSNIKSFIDLKDENDQTALACSICSMSTEITKLLLLFDADIMEPAIQGNTYLHLAVQYGDYTAVGFILKKCRAQLTDEEFAEYINRRGEYGHTALFVAAISENIQMFVILLENGASVEIPDQYGVTILHKATISNNFTLANLILKRNAKPDQQDENGDTPLHIACRNSYRSIAFLLLSHGGNPMVPNKTGLLPLDCAGVHDIELIRPIYLNMRFLNESDRNFRRIICEDISKGNELFPIMVVNDIRISPAESLNVPGFVYSKDLPTPVVSGVVNEDGEGCVCQCNSEIVRRNYDAHNLLIKENASQNDASIFECSSGCPCNILTCRNRVVQNGLKLPLEIFKCQPQQKGWGVRCLSPIPQNTFICAYVGEYVEKDDLVLRPNHDYIIHVKEDIFIDAKFQGNVSRFLNHSCDANLQDIEVYPEQQDTAIPTIAFFAKRYIERLEELTFNYQKRQFSFNKTFVQCECGANNCIDNRKNTL